MNLDYINTVTQVYGGFSFREFLNATNRRYATYIMEHNTITYQDGENDEILTQNSMEGIDLRYNLIDALYGERLDGNNAPVDVFMIKRDMWESQDNELKDLLIFHEVCHWIEKRNYPELQLNENEIRAGEQLSEIANDISVQIDGCEDINHNANFGAILFHYLNQYDNNRGCELLAKSMLSNFLDDRTDDFVNVLRP